MTGVWLLGGLFMMAGATFSSGGFVGPDGFRGALIVLVLSLLPPYVLIMATYDGSLGASLSYRSPQGSSWFWDTFTTSHRSGGCTKQPIKVRISRE